MIIISLSQSNRDDVLGWFACGMTHDEILEDFPELTIEDILACFAYAADKERKIILAA